MNRPSSHYIESLIKVIQECRSETGEEFEEFMDNLLVDAVGYLDSDKSFAIIEALRSL